MKHFLMLHFQPLQGKLQDGYIVACNCAFNFSSPRPTQTVPFIIYTLSNARRFYSLMECLWVGKGYM